MTPRTEIEVLRAEDTVADLLNASAGTGFSRFPVIEGDLDETLGIVHVKQVFGIPAEQRAHTRLAQLAIAVPRVPSTLPGDTLMTEIRANGLQTALVVDEYGGTAGMVTVEDLIEEIVGDVRDEHDNSTPDVRRSGSGWEVSGLLRIDEVASATWLRKRNVRTLAASAAPCRSHPPPASGADPPSKEYSQPVSVLSSCQVVPCDRVVNPLATSPGSWSGACHALESLPRSRS